MWGSAMTLLEFLLGFALLCALVATAAFFIGRLIDYLQDAEDFDNE